MSLAIVLKILYRLIHDIYTRKREESGDEKVRACRMSSGGARRKMDVEYCGNSTKLAGLDDDEPINLDED